MGPPDTHRESINVSNQRIFGTDGVRGRFGDGWMTPAGVSAVGQAVGEEMAARRTGADAPVHTPLRALIAHDGRSSGPILALAAARGLQRAGYVTSSAGLMPTPGLALLTRLKGYDVGIMISASHNPSHDNGVKVFGPRAEKLADDVEMAIEERLAVIGDPVFAPDADPESPSELLEPEGLGEAYLEHLLNAAEGLNLAGKRIAVDCANGAGSEIAPRLLAQLGAEVVAVGCEPDGENINAGCGSTHPEALRDAVRASKCSLGIALDGDGDRCVLVDELGEVVHGDAVLTLLAQQASREEALPGNAIVATVMSNRGLHRALREVEARVFTVGVGDRRVVEGLVEHSLSLGGEQSGHIIFGEDNFFIGDGCYTALRVLHTVVASGKSLSELAGAFQPFPQVLVNVTVQSKPNLEGIPSVVASVRAIEEELGEDGRVLLRYSGTEPLARVMVEGPNQERISAQAEDLAALIEKELG
ncbi:MAG: phosphoglucosamine mutase [Planctomycetota bacterium]|jgi:phosphoglucosamine mutase